MFGLLLRSELLQGSALRTWNCVLNIANFFRYKFNSFRQPVMPRSRRRHHSRSRSRSRSHSHERDREPKRRRLESPDSSHHRRSVSAGNEVSPKKILSPMQLKKQEEKQKREEERIKLKQEKEDQKRKEREEREDKRRKEKEEREEQKRKEREEKEELKRKEKEEKEELKRKEKEEKEEQKRKEREEKEEQKRKEREEKEEQKRKEREEKELKKQQELDEKNKEKKKKDELKEKEKAAFVNFFRKSATSLELKKPELEQTLAFMPFAVKSDMRLAPVTRTNLSAEQKQILTDKLKNQLESVLYLTELKNGKKLGSSSHTWPAEDTDIVILEDSDIGEQVEEQPKVKKMRAKLLKFHENRRPAYFGTWRKKSQHITRRKPFTLDKTHFDYEVDSDDDWEEEEPGESLHGSEDEEKEIEPDDYEVDNDFFVPHGYLSDEEIEAEENKEISPECQKEKLKILQIEFDEEMKSKTERIKPRLIGCIWENKIIPKVQDAIHKFLEDRMMIVTGTIRIQKRDLFNSTVKLSATKQLDKELIPDFLQLLHGNTNNQVFLVNEFLNYLNSKRPDISFSKAFLTSQLKQFAKWKKCPDDGPMMNKLCWYVEEETRSKYNINPELPNKWTYSETTNEEIGAKKTLVF